jgi:hypothetical protein
MRITSGGNVGIGTCTPFAIADKNLTINGTSSAVQLGISDVRHAQFYADGTEVRLYAVANVHLRLGTNDTERMRICATGDSYFTCALFAKTLGTNDLLLNNLNYECANYVDGTRGSWLIQEGACDLFIINQISCKKYKFNLIEIK